MSRPRSKAKVAARVALGAVFTIFGLNGFLHFLPQPQPVGTAAAFLGGLAASGFMFPLVKGVEVLAGVLLLANRFVPLALTVLAPIVVNITAFHLFLDPAGLVLPLVITALGVYLATTEKAVFAPFFRSRNGEEEGELEPRRASAAL
jgi:uncharacterized membrane protein YphA (DoxX/SURF4 family)